MFIDIFCFSLCLNDFLGTQVVLGSPIFVPSFPTFTNFRSVNLETSWPPVSAYAFHYGTFTHYYVACSCNVVAVVLLPCNWRQ